MESVKLNFEIPGDMSLEIDQMLLTLKKQGMKKTKVELIIELMQMGLNEANDLQ
jgi:hypothetical protein